MKKILYTAMVASGIMLTTSCVDLLQEPQSFKTQEEYMGDVNIESLQKVTRSLYKDLWNDNYGFNCRMQSINVGADDVTFRAAKAANRLGYFYNLSPDIMQNDADVNTMWMLLFKSINDANSIINNTIIPKVNKEQIQSVVGESYFVRGFAYLYLVRLFGDVPLILKEKDAENRMPRTSVSEIYDKAIVPSLIQAAKWLPEKQPTPASPSRWAAKLCLADAYMSMAGWPLHKNECYALAAAEAKDIIENSGLHLCDEYKNLWKEENKNSTEEVMFALIHSVADGMASQYGKSYYPVDYYPNAGWADYYVNGDFFNKYPNDERKEWNFMTEWMASTGEKDENNKDIIKKIHYTESSDKLPAISKFYDYDEGEPGKSQLSNGMTCLYRYAEAMLIYAEASTRATGNVDNLALQCIQDIQKRAGYERKGLALTSTTIPEDFLDAVSNERGWEFFAEMKRWFELVRLEKLQDVKPEEWKNSLFKNNGHYYMPIPYLQIPLTGWENNKGY